MLSNIALVGSLLLASIARATPSAPPLNAGGVYVSPPKDVLSITGALTIPTTLTGNLGDQVSFSVGIGDFVAPTAGCSSSSFLLGIVGDILPKSQQKTQISYNATFFNPANGSWQAVPEFDVAPGDYITMTITINPKNKTSGHGTISKNKGKHTRHVDLSTGSSLALCSHIAGWVIETLNYGDTIGFGTVEIQHANVLTEDNKKYLPSDPSFAYTFNDTESGSVPFTFKTNGDTITVQSPKFQ